ncbi:hypothetical protein ABEB36_012865 [Hypothenemus hampei]|uniref:Uncharacterized protein n=1 Tax=Hypothenemus hampei TaxID=57062 RepID=A0ABD1E6A0_HYPHA
MQDIMHFHNAFYENTKKYDQDVFILRHCNVTNPKRHRKRQQNNNKPKSCTLKYNIKKQDGSMVPICRQTFLGVLGVRKDRILSIVKKFQKYNKLLAEARGGDRILQKN